MNKNTLIGLLLMGIVIMLFMKLNAPTQEQIEAQKAQQEQLDAALDEQSTTPAMTLDTVAPAERQAIIETVRKNGSLDASTGLYTLTAPDVTLTATADSVATLGGSVTVDGVSIPAQAIVNASYPDSVSVLTASQALALLRQTIDNTTRYQGFSQFLNGKDEVVATLKNDVLSLEFSSLGGVIAQAELLDPKYKKYPKGQVTPIAKGDDMYGFIITSGDTQYDTRQLYFTAVQESDSTVLMQIQPGDGVMLGLRYTLPRGNSYEVGMELVQQNMQSIIPTTVSGMEFAWSQKMQRNEEGRMFEEQQSGLYFMTTNENVDNLSENDTKERTIDEPMQWIAFKNQFFTTLLVSDKGFGKSNLKSTNLKDDQDFVKEFDVTSHMDYSSSLATPAAFTFFIGPNSYPLLSDLSETMLPEKDLHLTKLIPLGWGIFRWINTWVVIPVFTFLGHFDLSYGIIILLLTIFIKVILFPFTYKSYMSQAKMRVLTPEIKEINEKYPGQENAMKRQQETMALYNKAGANPMSGCLPMLLQLPILIAMFKFFPSAIELRGESFLWAHDLSAPDYVIHLPFAIPFLGNKLSLFCLLMTAVNIIYTRINMQNQPGGSSMPAMKWMMYLMPVMFLVFFNNYASGLSYYYLLSLFITIIQTYVFRRIVDEDKVRATMRANAAKPKKKSGFMARLEEAQRRQQQMLREQEKQRSKKR